MQVIDYTLKEYIEGSQDVQDSVSMKLKFGKFRAVDHFNTGGYKKASFGFIKLLQMKINSGAYTWDVFIDSLIEEKKLYSGIILNTSVYKCKEQIEYLINEIKTVNEMEKNKLSGFRDSTQERAGIEKFSVYGNFIQIDKLAGGDVLKYKEIEKQPYLVLFTKLAYDADVYEFNQRLLEIQKRKNKT